jgi:hypothetical protein
MSRSTFSRRLSFFAAIALAIPLSLAAAPTIAADLDAAHSEAVALRTSADNLLMLARTPMQYSFEAHATELARARDLADRIGGRLERLNSERAEATPAQLEKIDAMEARLRAVTRNVDIAIQAFNHRNGTADLYGAAYQTRVQDLYNEAKALAHSAGTIAAD